MNETIADIIADLREHSGEMTPSLVCFTEDGGIDFSALAARIEAAWKHPVRNCDLATSGTDALGRYRSRLPARYYKKADEYDSIGDFAAWLYQEAAK